MYLQINNNYEKKQKIGFELHVDHKTIKTIVKLCCSQKSLKRMNKLFGFSQH